MVILYALIAFYVLCGLVALLFKSHWDRNVIVDTARTIFFSPPALVVLCFALFVWVILCLWDRYFNGEKGGLLTYFSGR